VDAGMKAPAGPVRPEEPDRTARLRIGEAAAQAGVSTRTLRYYQELGLLTPSTTIGGARRYSDADVARITRIRHLSDLVGLDLNEVARVLRAEDRLADIRREWWDGQTPRRRAALLREAGEINEELREIVRSKMAGLRSSRPGWRSGPSSSGAATRSWRATRAASPDPESLSVHGGDSALNSGRASPSAGFGFRRPLPGMAARVVDARMGTCPDRRGGGLGLSRPGR